MTTFVLSGEFPNLSHYTLSGTIDITGNSITAMDAIIADLHFTKIYFNQYQGSGQWLLSGNTANSTNSSEDYFTFNFRAGPDLTSFQQAIIVNGAAVHNVYLNGSATSTTYYGLSLAGTICPLDGCLPFPPPVVQVPGPIAGSGLIGVLLLLTFFTSRIRNLCNAAR